MSFVCIFVFCVQTLMYEIGFLVCAAIGVLYIVLMPIVGFFLACCRCCGNCGGKMYQKQTSSIHCRRRTLYWSAFITTVIILWVCALMCVFERYNDVLSEISIKNRRPECACLTACVCLLLNSIMVVTHFILSMFMCLCIYDAHSAGNICMFKSNENLKVSVDQSPDQLNKTIDNINTFITSVPQVGDWNVMSTEICWRQKSGSLMWQFFIPTGWLIYLDLYSL